MTFEADLVDVVKAADPALNTKRVFLDFAPTNTGRPYATIQSIGGDVINPLANDVPGLENQVVQIDVWADSRLQAVALIHAIAAAMRGATAFSAQPVGAHRGDFDAELRRYCARQDFSCWYGPT